MTNVLVAHVPYACWPFQKNHCDTANFDSDFTRMTPNFTPIPSQALNTVDQNDFKSFSYVNEKYVPRKDVSVTSQGDSDPVAPIPSTDL